MNWIGTVFAAILGWITGRERSKGKTLKRVNAIYRKAQKARNNSEIDTRFRRD